MESVQQQTPAVQQAPQQEAPASTSAAPGNRERAEAAGFSGAAGDPGVVIANLPALRANPEEESVRLLLTLPAGGGFLGQRARFEAGVAAWEQQDGAGIERAWAAEDPEMAAVLGDVPSEEESVAIRMGVRATFGRLCVARMMQDSGALGVLKGTVSEGGEPAWAALEADYPGCRAELEGAIPAGGTTATAETAAAVPAAAAGQATGTAGNLPKTKAEALKRHEAGRQKVAKVIQAALAIEPGSDPYSLPNRLRNSAQWVTTEHDAPLYILTPTHDGVTRAPAGKVAHFDTRKRWDEAGSDYETSSDVGIDMVNINTGGYAGEINGTESIAFIDPADMTEGSIAELLIHEVQHDADQHSGEWSDNQTGIDEMTGVNVYFNAYHSEFRAYWYEAAQDERDIFGSSDMPAKNGYTVFTSQKDKTGTEIEYETRTNFDNGRQENIFWFMAEAKNFVQYEMTPDISSNYAYLPYFYAKNKTFRLQVDQLIVPESGNQINSPRIQTLSEEIANEDFQAVMNAIRAMELGDWGILRDNRFIERQIRESDFPPTQQAAIRLSLLAFSSVPQLDQEPWYRVQKGDTLEGIASRILGSASRAQEIYALNRERLNSPDIIQVGILLDLPEH